MATSSFVFLDLETTGLHTSSKIIEICLISVNREHILNAHRNQDYGPPRVLNKLVLCMYPGELIPSVVTELTGLSNDLLEEFSTFNSQTVSCIHSFLSQLSQPVCLLAHNGYRFDFPVLRSMLRKINLDLPEFLRCADTLPAFRDVLLKWNTNALKVDAEIISGGKEDYNMLEDGNDALFLELDDSVSNAPDQIQDFVEVSSESKLDELKSSCSQLSWEKTHHTPKRTKYVGFPNGTHVSENNHEKEPVSNLSSNVKNIVIESDVSRKKQSTSTDKNKIRTRRDLFPFAPRSFKLVDIFEKLRHSRPVCHRAETDVLMMMECVMYLGNDILEYFDENFKLFKDF